MISAIVLVPDLRRTDDVDRVRETVVRSLAWLVSAVVAGVVREVVLTGPATVGLAGIADQVGCRVVEGGGEAQRIGAAVAGVRDARVLILRVGYQPDAGLTDAIDVFVRRAGADAAALILRAPETMLERILPGWAPVVGLLLPRDRAGTGSFDQLVRRAGRATRLRARADRLA